MSATSQTLSVVLIAVAVCLTNADPAYAQSGNVRVHGRIVDEAGHPLPETEVVLLADGEPSSAHPATITDDEGRYQFSAVPIAQHRWQCTAYHEGFAINAVAAKPSMTGGGNAEIIELEDLVLLAPLPLTVDVVAPDGESVDVESVDFASIYTEEMVSLTTASFPETWPSLMKLDGSQIQLFGTSHGSRLRLRVTTDEFGSQTASIENNGENWTLQLLEVSTISGRIESDIETVPLDFEVQATSRQSRRGLADNPNQLARPSSSSATVKANSDGVFRIEKIGTGSVRLELTNGIDDRFLATGELSFALLPGEEKEVVPQVVEAVLAHCRIVDPEGNAIPGIEVAVDRRTYTTNQEGKFSFYALQGTARIGIRSLPDPWLPPPPSGMVYATIGGDVKEVDLPTIRLDRSRLIRGRVLDAGDKPVSGANVLASWFDSNGQGGSLGAASTTTNEEGEFELTKVRPNASISLRASNDTMATVKPITIGQSDEERHTLIVSKDGMIDLNGRVQTPDGSPIPKARIEIWSGHKLPDMPTMSRGVLRFSNKRFISTDANGQFHSDRPLSRYAEYHVVASADGFKSVTTDPLSPNDSGEFTLPDVILAPLRTISGIVTDQEGMPLNDVTVWAHGLESGGRSETLTNAKGEFSINNVSSDALFAFASADRYRMGGAPLLDDEAIRIQLDRVEETPRERPSVAEAIEWEQRRNIGIDLLNPWIERAIDNGDSRQLRSRLRKLCQIDPERALESFGDSEDPAARLETIGFAGEPEEVIAESRSVDDLNLRVIMLCRASEQTDNQVAKLAILNEAALSCQGIESPSHRVAYLAMTSEAFKDAGDDRSAEALARVAQQTADKLGAGEWEQYTRGLAAKALSSFDMEEAWILIASNLESSDRLRCLTNMAHEIGASNPEGAEWLIEKMPTDHRGSAIVRTASRMARTDPDRALRLANKISGLGQLPNQALAFGVVAMGVHEQDEERARELLRKAFESLRRFESSDQAFTTALMLLHYSRTIDPDSLKEYGWYVLSIHPGPTVDRASNVSIKVARDIKLCEQALVLRLTHQHPEFSRSLLDSVAEEWLTSNWPEKVNPRRVRAIHAALLLDRPAQCSEWLISLLEGDEPLDRYQLEILELVTNLLCSPEGKLHESIPRFVFYQWVIGKEDYASQMAD